MWPLKTGLTVILKRFQLWAVFFAKITIFRALTPNVCRALLFSARPSGHTYILVLWKLCIGEPIGFKELLIAALGAR